MNLAIHELVAARPDAARVDEFLGQHSFPLVEGRSATFVFRGEADAVHLTHWIYGLESAQPFTRIEGTDLWFLVIEIPEKSRVEYKLHVRRGDLDELLLDPLNPNLAHDPFGANSALYGAGYESPEWAEHNQSTRPGVLRDLRFHSDALGGERRVRLYLPARFRRTRTYPLLVVHDGGDYLRFSKLKNVLDNLIHRLEIPSLVAALTYPENRLVEYADHEPHARFLSEELIPELERNFPLEGTPRSRSLMGASFGAVAAFSTARRYPDMYGKLLLQSGSFAFTDIGESRRGPAFDPVVRFMNSYRDDPVRLSEKLFVSCGTYESLIYENRSLVPILQQTGMDVRYVESRDGHNWENWRDRLREGLSWLHPGPLWMVYE